MTPEQILAALVKPTYWPDPPADELQAKHRAEVHAQKVAMIAAAFDVGKMMALVEAAERFNTRAVMADNRALVRCIDKLRAALAAFRTPDGEQP